MLGNLRRANLERVAQLLAAAEGRRREIEAATQPAKTFDLAELPADLRAAVEAALQPPTDK